MQGLRSHHWTEQSCEIGEYIYCGQREGVLSDEHSIPFGLNGPWVLRHASCDSCAKITSRFERDVMRSLWPDVRNVLAMKSRRKEKRSPSIPLEIHENGQQRIVLIPRTEFPTYLTAPIFPPPACYWSNRPVNGVFANMESIHLSRPTFREASKEFPGADFIGAHANFSPEAFARMLAKIGYYTAVAVIGIKAFTTTRIRNIILATDPCIGHWVGSWWKETINDDPNGGLHQIKIVHSQPGNEIHAMIRLFAQFGAPEYHVMLGPADPTYVASDAWPLHWRDAKPEDLLYV